MVTYMISCIICSRNKDIPEELKENISSTIGCEYELIVIDNSSNSYSIFSAYNEGVRRSKGDILCFMHEDIIYHTQNWGVKVLEHFRNENVGLLGVEGTHFSANYPSPWWSSSLNSGQLIQGNTINGIYSSEEEYLWNRKEGNSIEGVIVDGLWMCISRKLFNNNAIKFDEDTYNGFHCYDADICMQVLSIKRQVHIVFDILIEHKSLGNPDIRYFNQLDIWHNKWSSFLPLMCGIAVSEIDIQYYELVCRRYTDLFRSNVILSERLESLYKSNAYKIGKFILYPLKKILRK